MQCLVFAQAFLKHTAWEVFEGEVKLGRNAELICGALYVETLSSVGARITLGVGTAEPCRSAWNPVGLASFLPRKLHLPEPIAPRIPSSVFCPPVAELCACPQFGIISLREL